ncbi:MAG TPA: hypothetical protein VKU00_11620 [Chthonomonadaceae bacterium]|nr:hypothetical protein [Chthonomonadaceae bacterium]
MSSPPEMSASPGKFILYACPTGELALQLDRYFEESRRLYGENAAHGYMPHISLTGFFCDLPAAIPTYLRILERLMASNPPPNDAITLSRLRLDPDFHGFEVESAWCHALVADWIADAPADTRQEAIRPKDWLHLSLAYRFPPAQHAALKTLAEATVHQDAAVGWELRFYERPSDLSWTCHWRHSITP